MHRWSHSRRPQIWTKWLRVHSRLRWLSGIFGLIGIVWMTWDTLKIPNTQAATGMLYVGVIAVFLGELTSLLLSHGKPLPL